MQYGQKFIAFIKLNVIALIASAISLDMEKNPGPDEKNGESNKAGLTMCIP